MCLFVCACVYACICLCLYLCLSLCVCLLRRSLAQGERSAAGHQSVTNLQIAFNRIERFAQGLVLLGVVLFVFGVFGPWGFQAWACAMVCFGTAFFFLRRIRIEPLPHELFKQSSTCVALGQEPPRYLLLFAVLVGCCSVTLLCSGIMGGRAGDSIAALSGEGLCACVCTRARACV